MGRLNRIIASIPTMIQVKKISIALLIFCCCSQAFADLRYRWKLLKVDTDFLVEIRNPDTLRLSLSDDFYLLSSQDGIYAIINDRVLDVLAFHEELRDLWIVNYFGERMHKRVWRVPHKDALIESGETINYADIEVIKVYADVMITNDDRILYLKQVMQSFSNRNIQHLAGTGFEVMNQAMHTLVPMDKAIVRYSDRFELTALEEVDLPDEHFSLPKNAKIRNRPGLVDLGMAAKIILPLAVD